MLIPVILSGGAGSRLWPASREASPKPFMKLAEGKSLLRMTHERARAVAPEADVFTVTNREYLFKSRDEYGRDAGPSSFVLEPFGRNTAPAIAMAAMQIRERFGDEALMLILAADHLITDLQAFAMDVSKALELAEQGYLVTFGIQPSRPETGYGYIELGTALDEPDCFKVSRFVEKPARSLAEQYVQGGQYLWNSGMFCFSVRAFLQSLEALQPELAQAARACSQASVNRSELDCHILELDAAAFGRMSNVAVDIAVMERATNVAVVKAGFDWSDVGSWDVVHAMSKPDGSGNSIAAEAILVDVQGTYIQSEGRLVGAVGLRDMVIVDTPDALLVADRNRTQDVKKVVEQLKLRNHDAAVHHRTVARPWGTYTVLEEGPGFKIKRIVVKPGASLSLQMHHHRSEHWVVVTGTAKVVNGDRTLTLQTNESTYIPAGHVHRLENPGLLDLVIIEVQCGSYLGEDDIVRFQDAYGRVPAAPASAAK